METIPTDQYILHRIKFILLLLLQIPSVILSLFILIFFILHHTLLNKLHNKALFILFFINFIQLLFNLPMVINFFRLSYVTPSTRTYCKWWIYIEYTLDAASEFLVATISIQRHILIFQPHILRICFKRYLLYYFPLLLCILYPIIFYMIVVVFYPCDDTQWDFTSNMCGDTTCYLIHNRLLATFDWTVNTGLPTIVIMLANIGLIIRVINQKHNRQQTIVWSKQRRMTLQLLSISSLYLITWTPSIISGIIQQINSSEFIYQIQNDYISDLPYFICLFLPWICLGLLPGFKEWIFRLYRRLKESHNLIRPIS